MNKYVIGICWFFVAFWVALAIGAETLGNEFFFQTVNNVALTGISWLSLIVVLSNLVANYAQNKGRSYWKYFILCFLLSPIITFIIAAVSRPSEESKEKSAIKRGGKKCPACAEVVKADAKICKHCRSDLSTI
jgi:hypothetical protein